jgi:hypothetical protein
MRVGEIRVERVIRTRQGMNGWLPAADRRQRDAWHPRVAVAPDLDTLGQGRGGGGEPASPGAPSHADEAKGDRSPRQVAFSYVGRNTERGRAATFSRWGRARSGEEFATEGVNRQGRDPGRSAEATPRGRFTHRGGEMTGDSSTGSCWMSGSFTTGSDCTARPSRTGGDSTVRDFVITGVEVTTAGTLAMTPRLSRTTTLFRRTLTRLGATTTGGGAITSGGVTTVSRTVTRRPPSSWASARPASMPRTPMPNSAENPIFRTISCRMISSLNVLKLGADE